MLFRSAGALQISLIFDIPGSGKRQYQEEVKGHAEILLPALRAHVNSTRFRNFVTGACNLPQDWDSKAEAQERMFKKNRFSDVIKDIEHAEVDEPPHYDLGIGDDR